MKRRAFLIGAAGAAVLRPHAASAQQSNRTMRIGVLVGLPASDPLGEAEFNAFQEGLRELGWAHGRNVEIEQRWPGAITDRIGAAAKELVALQPDVIVTRGTPSTAAAKRETTTIPIVFLQVSDPLGEGFVQSLAHPGGSITGFINFEASLGGKWLQL